MARRYMKKIKFYHITFNPNQDVFNFSSHTSRNPDFRDPRYRNAQELYNALDFELRMAKFQGELSKSLRGEYGVLMDRSLSTCFSQTYALKYCQVDTISFIPDVYI